MAGVFVPPGMQRFVDPLTGDALSGGFVFHYIPGTDTPKDTWQDEAETALNTNPIILDADGMCIIWGEGLFRQVLQRADTTEIWDQVTGFNGSGSGGVTFATPAQVAALTRNDLVISPYALGASGVLGGGGGSGYGSSFPLASLGTLDLSGVTVGNNDTILAAAEADATNLHFYGPAGTIRTNLTKEQLTKGYEGDAAFITGPGAGDGAFRPPSFSFMTVKPSTWPVQGDGGFWRGDQRFTDGGEWKIIGPNVRTYDITARYFESNTIPHAAWLDTQSGASGIDAYLTSGASIGATVITINGPATLGWIGKTVAFANGPDGVVVESHTVSNVSGSTITISTALTHAYTWNPSGGSLPCIFFGKRTSASQRYTKIRHAGAGDNYIDVARNNNNYVPLASQYHVAMTATTGQYGGDVTFGADGVYGQFFESQLQGGNFDVTAVGFVGSFVRNNDTALDGGKFWGGTWYQSGGSRPADAGFILLGLWRNGLDTVFATMEETSRLTVAAGAGTTVFTLASVNGAHPNDTFVVGSETLTIQSVNVGAKQVTTTSACAGTYAVGQFCQYPQGGAVVNMSLGQRQVWNSSLSINARGGDPMGVYPSWYGNVQGDLIMGSGNDGSSDFWSIRFARGTTAATPDSARLRLRPTGINVFGTAHTFAGSISIAAGLGVADLNLPAGGRLSLGAGAWITFNGSNIVGTINGGGSFTTLV
jgi:hypothetical protein